MGEEPERLAQTLRGALWHGQGLGGHNNYRAAEEALGALLADVERLADRNELQEACLTSLERIMFDSKAGKSRDEMEARAEALVASEVQAERLAGRVAALEAENALLAAALNSATNSLADVGGSE